MANNTAANKPEVVKEKIVKIIVPKTRELQDDVFVSVNDRTWQIQRGVEVEVPECVVEVLKHQTEMENIALAYEAQASSPKNH
jgi:hypothetical protein